MGEDMQSGREIDVKTPHEQTNKALSARWSGPCGYKEVLRVGMPLVLSMASATIMQFTDRIFLSRYSLEAIAAVVPAGILAFLFMSFFMGTAEYVSVFVAQYTGAGRPHRVGSALWQGIWFTLAAWLVLAAVALLARPLLGLGGHPDAVMELEVVYFRILSLGSGLGLMGVTLSTFFSGRGMTVPVMVANMIGAAVNIPLDYALINGVWGMPEMGIAGAALATVVAGGVTFAVMALMVFRPEADKLFHVRTAWRPDWDLLKRLVRFGVPGGVQFFIDMFAITFFLFMVGRLGAVELAATNIAISIDLLAFLPLVGISIAVSVLVGQCMGAGNPDRAARALGSGLRLGLLWMAGAVVLFLVLPQWLYELFRAQDAAGPEFEAIKEQGIILLRFVALYSLMDAVAVVVMGALKGAGDTRFVMIILLGCALGTMIVPLFLVLEVFHLGLEAMWWCVTGYVAALAGLSAWRFRRGSWRTMRVIEEDEGEAGQGVG